MKFLVLMAEEDHFDRWDASSDAERQDFFDGLARFSSAVGERGQILAGEGLSRPERAITLRDGAATEGPYAETVEQVGGLYIVELPSLEDAVELGRLLPAPVVEIRPLPEV